MKVGKKWSAVVLLIVLTVVSSACSKKTAKNVSGECGADKFGCATYQKGDPIWIGTLLAISDGAAFLGDDSLNGVKLGVDYLDGKFDGVDGTLLGHSVRIQSVDDGCSKDGGQTGGTKLASDPTVLAVIGTTCSSSALGVADTILSAKGILLVSPSNTAAGLTAPDKHQAFYARTAQNDAIQAKVVSDFVSGQLKLTKVATIHDESPYAAGLTGGFKTFFEKAGGTVTSEQAINSKDTDFTSLLTTIAQTSPQLIYLPDFNPGCALIAKQAATIPGLSGVKLMGSDGCLDTSFFDIAGSAGNGFYTSGPIPSPGTTTSDLVAKYTKAYKADYGDPTASFNQNAFDAFNILMEAVKKVAIKNSDGSLSIPRTKLRDALFATKDWQGLTGNVTCNQYGDCQSVATVNIGVYLEPKWPIKGGDPSATPVYSEKLTLAQALGA